MALSEATQEAVWLKVFLCELGEMTIDESVKIYEDNQGSIALAKNSEFHKRTKHIDIRYTLCEKRLKMVKSTSCTALHKTCLLT